MRIHALLKRTGRFPILLLCFLSLMAVVFADFKNDPSSAKSPDPSASKQPVINAAISEFEPALAVRTSACITCHAKIHPGFITDFGYGDGYFFGKPGGGSRFGAFDGM